MDRNEKPPAATGGDGRDIDEYTVENKPPFEIAQAMIDRGFRPVPVKHATKAPYHGDWQKRHFTAGNFQFNDGVGLLLGAVICIDIDIMDETTAHKVETLTLSSLGPSSCRVGLWPKRALFFRATGAMKKTFTKRTPAGRVEVLAEGQQVVIHGIHRDTQQPYRWRGAPPWSPSFELVTVTPEQVQQFLHDAEVLLGFDPVEAVATTVTGTHMPAAPSIDTNEMPRAEDLAKALAGFWSADAYDDWTTAGLALTGHPEGREIWMAWSATSSKHTDIEASAKWLELSRSSRGDITAEKILSRVPTTELQAWGRLNRIAELASDPAVAHGGEVADAIMPSRRSAPEAVDNDEDHEHPDDDEAAPEPPQGHREAVPEHLLRVPGVLQQAVDFYNQSARRPQPRFAVQTALALGSVVMGRRFVTPMRNYSSLFFLSVADTATGKEHIKSVIEHLLDAAGLIRLIGPDGYTSSSGVLSALLAQPCHITVLDEAGKALASARSRGMQYKADALTTIMELFGRCDRTLRGQGFSHIGLSAQQREEFSKVVHRPALTLIGMSTPSTMEIALSDADVQDGFLNRFLFARGSDALVAKSSNPWPAVPEALTTWMQACASAHGGEGILSGMDTADFPPKPVMVPFTPEALELFKQFDDEIRQRQGGGPTPRAMLGRTHEHALRLSLIVSASMGGREIDTEAASWAIDYARHHALEFLAEAEVLAAPSEAARWAAKLVEQVHRAGGEITHSRLVKNLRGWAGHTTRERETILAMAAVDHGLVVEQRRSAKGKGPVFQVYCSTTVRHRMSNSKKASSG